MAQVRMHDLKTWSAPFKAVYEGRKNFEIRKDDRCFSVGDLLRLREYLPKDDKYTGWEILARVTYKAEPGSWGLPDDLCVLGIDVVQRTEDGMDWR